MTDKMEFKQEDATAGMPEGVKDAPIGPMHGLAAIALNMALKYHDINTVQDGTLYQQYKLEGKNMRGLCLEEVFHTAMQIEAHMVKANERITNLLLGVLESLPDVEEGDEKEPTATSPEQG